MDPLRYAFIVSQAELVASPEAAAEGEFAAYSARAELEEGGGALAVGIARADGAKCNRCWNYRRGGGLGLGRGLSLGDRKQRRAGPSACLAHPPPPTAVPAYPIPPPPRLQHSRGLRRRAPGAVRALRARGAGAGLCAPEGGGAGAGVTAALPFKRSFGRATLGSDAFRHCYIS